LPSPCSPREPGSATNRSNPMEDLAMPPQTCRSDATHPHEPIPRSNRIHPVGRVDRSVGNDGYCVGCYILASFTLTKSSTPWK
jgi:chitodextrinase